MSESENRRLREILDNELFWSGAANALAALSKIWVLRPFMSRARASPTHFWGLQISV
jgi:hypothetical protein